MNAFLGKRVVASTEPVGSALQRRNRAFDHLFEFCILGPNELESDLFRFAHQESPQVMGIRDLTLPGARESCGRRRAAACNGGTGNER